MNRVYGPAAVKYRASFIRPRWRKVLRDLWHNKLRTTVVVLSIAIGVFAVGMIVTTQLILSHDLNESYLATDPASAVLFPDHFDQGLVETVRHIEGVKEAQGRRSIGTQVLTGPDEQMPLQMDVFDDFNDIRLNRIYAEEGAWPPAKKEILIERSYLSKLNAKIGDTITIETQDGKQRQLRIAGLAHDLNLPPAQFVDEVRGYITLETLEWLGFEPEFDEMHILVTENSLDETHIRAVAELVEEKIKNSGRTNYWIWVPTPGEHPANEAVQPLLAILGVLGGLSLFLSGFLVVNTISALLGQQVRQIGIMKAIGAGTGQIVQMYLVSVLIFGLTSLVVAVPLAGYVAYEFTRYLANLINFNMKPFHIPPTALALEVAIGLIVPFLAALVPVFSGTRVSAALAMHDIGLGKGHFGGSLLDRLLQTTTSTMHAISRPMRISLRNAIRRKARLVLTLSTLTLGGAIFIAVLSVHASLLKTLDDALSYWNYHVDVNFSNTHRIAEIEQEALKVPGVVAAESWIGNSARRIRPDGIEGPDFSILGTPAETTMIQPSMLEGRWLLPEDENAVVVNTTFLEEEPDLKVGDDLIVTMQDRQSTWRIVGIVRGVMTGRLVYANYPYFAKETRFIGRSGNAQIVGDSDDPADQAALAKRIKDYFESLGMRVRSTETTASTRINIVNQFNIIVFFLAFMAVLIALVGGLGLMGTMSMNVMERTREIGVMRAVGADDGAILRIILVEGVFIGLISWFIGAIAALPISQLMSNVVGMAFLQSPLSYTFSMSGALLWLGLVLVLSSLASFLPSWNASRLTIREVLAYE